MINILNENIEEIKKIIKNKNSQLISIDLNNKEKETINETKIQEILTENKETNFLIITRKGLLPNEIKNQENIIVLTTDSKYDKNNRLMDDYLYYNENMFEKNKLQYTDNIFINFLKLKMEELLREEGGGKMKKKKILFELKLFIKKYHFQYYKFQQKFLPKDFIEEPKIEKKEKKVSSSISFKNIVKKNIFGIIFLIFTIIMIYKFVHSLINLSQ
jgi:hypothetical protein